MERATPTDRESSEEKLKFSVDRILKGQISKRKADWTNEGLNTKCPKPTGKQRHFFIKVFFGKIDNVFLINNAL